MGLDNIMERLLRAALEKQDAFTLDVLGREFRRRGLGGRERPGVAQFAIWCPAISMYYRDGSATHSWHAVPTLFGSYVGASTRIEKLHKNRSDYTKDRALQIVEVMLEAKRVREVWFSDGRKEILYEDGTTLEHKSQYDGRGRPLG